MARGHITDSRCCWCHPLIRIGAAGFTMVEHMERTNQVAPLTIVGARATLTA